ncbi:MAG: hypothetical protein WD042_14640 [Phycisphaeraceae bacterium]
MGGRREPAEAPREEIWTIAGCRPQRGGCVLDAAQQQRQQDEQVADEDRGAGWHGPRGG